MTFLAALTVSLKLDCLKLPVRRATGTASDSMMSLNGCPAHWWQLINVAYEYKACTFWNGFQQLHHEIHIIMDDSSTIITSKLSSSFAARRFARTYEWLRVPVQQDPVSKLCGTTGRSADFDLRIQTYQS